MSLPARPANLKAHAERIVRAIEEDRLEQMIRVPRGLKRAADQLCEHYHRKRNNQGLKNTLIEPEFSPRSEGTCSAITSVARICRWRRNALNQERLFRKSRATSPRFRSRRIASILHKRSGMIMFAVTIHDSHCSGTAVFSKRDRAFAKSDSKRGGSLAQLLIRI